VALSAQPPGPQPAGPQPATAPPRARKADRTVPSLFPVRTIWTLALNNLLAFPPAYEGTRGYFPLTGDRIVAYDLLPGTQTWIVDAHPKMEPVAGGGLLFFVDADSLTALNGDDGSVAWQLPFAEPLAVHPVWDNGWLVVATEAGTVRAIRATDGESIWSRDLGARAHAMPALAADRVYVPLQDNRIVALRVDTGEPIWERKLGGAPDQILALDDRLYVGSKDNFFYCVTTKDGRVDWRWRTGGDVIGLPIVDERRVFFVALDNVMRALDRESGVQKWMRPLPLRPMAGPVRVGSSIVVTGFAPSLKGFNAADGVAASDITAGSEVAAPPYVVPDPTQLVPDLLFVTRDIAKGATVTLVTRSFEPIATPIAPLPNLITFGPATTTPK
jgi:outer membrane protein assembly factor BamB